MVIYQVSDHHTGSDFSPRKVLCSPFLFPIHHRMTQEVKRKSAKQQDTYECPEDNTCNLCHPSLLLCRANDVPVTPNGSAEFCCSLGMSQALPHRAAPPEEPSRPYWGLAGHSDVPKLPPISQWAWLSLRHVKSSLTERHFQEAEL